MPPLETIHFGPRLAYAQGTTTTLQLAKSAPASVDQGALLRYTLYITNTGTVAATKAIVTDTIPSLGIYTRYVPPDDGGAGVSPDSDGDWYNIHPSGSSYILWGTADAFPPPFSGRPLPPHGRARLYFNVRVVEPVPDQTEIVNGDYQAYAENAQVVRGGNVVTRVNAPHWAISKRVSSSTVQPGEYLTYTITASNDGHLAATGIYTITDLIPQYTNYVTSIPPATRSGALLTWVFSETMAIGASRVVTYVVRVADHPLTDGLSLVNAAYSVTGGKVYAGAVGSPVTSTVQAPMLHITKHDSLDPIWPGGMLTYTLTYSNSGGAGAPDVSITDTFDSHTRFVSSNPPPTGGLGSTRYWDIGELASRASGAIVVTVSVTAPLASGTLLTNTARIASPLGYASQATETTQVQGTPILHLLKQANTNVVEPGDLITYTLSYSNSGNAPAVGVLVTDSIDPNTSFQSATPGYSGSYVWNIGTLWPSTTHQITLTVRVTDSLPNGTILANNATIRASGNISDTDQATVTVTSAPILHLAKEASADTLEPGDTLTYTIWYSNTGNAPATGVVITDTLPPQLHMQSAHPPASGGGNQQWVWNLGQVNVGGPHSITLVVTSDDTMADLTSLTNRVALSCLETVPITAEETVTVYAVDLEAYKTASSSLVKANELITYTITVINKGHAAADQVRITDTLPISIAAGSVVSSTSAGLVLESATPPTYVWTTPELGPLAQASITIGGRLVPSPWSADGNLFYNTVEVHSNAAEANLFNNSAERSARGRPGDVHSIILTATPNQTAVGNTVLVTATVADAWGNPAYNGQNVSFSTSLGTISPGNDTTQDGLATSNLSSTLPGIATVTGTVGSIQATTLVTFTPGAAHHFVFAPTIPSPQTAGVPFTVTILAMDRYDNLVPTYNTSASLGDLTGRMLPVNTGTGWSGGIWSKAVTITGAMHNDVISINDGVISGTSNAFDVRPGPAASADLTVTPSMPPCGATSVHTATLFDAYGNTLWAGVPATFYLIGSSASLVPSSPYVDYTNDAGMVTATVRSSNSTGSVILALDIDGRLIPPEATGTITVSGVGIATDLQVAALPPAIVVGNTSVVSATLRDCAGQPVPGTNVGLAVSGLGSLLPINGPTNTAGVFTSTFSAGLTPGTAVVSATSGSLLRTTSIAITGGPVFVITKTADPAPGTTVSMTETITYLIVVTNTGTQASNFELTDPIPVNSEYVPGSVSASPWATVASVDPVRVTASSFGGAGQVLTVTFSVTPTAKGAISNQASIDSDQTGPQTSSSVTHSVVSGELHTVFLPLVLNHGEGTVPILPTNANLTITDIGFVGGAPPSEGQNYHVYVVISNQGSEPVLDDFWVDLYLNPINPPPRVNQPWQILSQSGTQGNCPSDQTCYGRAWLITADMAPGSSITLTTQMPTDQRYDRWPSGGAPYARRHSPIMALVDSWGMSYGAIFENNETDNLSGSISGAGLMWKEAVSDWLSLPAQPAGSQRPMLPGSQE